VNHRGHPLHEGDELRRSEEILRHREYQGVCLLHLTEYLVEVVNKDAASIYAFLAGGAETDFLLGQLYNLILTAK